MSEGGDLRNIKLRIAYDGGDFAGWQRQKDHPSVQGCIEDALGKIHKKKINLTGAGRTDAGVHAANQTANFYTHIASMTADRFVPALNSLLPRTIRILDAEEADPAFHSRFDAKSRTYRYRFIAGREPSPQELRYALRLPKRPRLETLNDYARRLYGEMDCTFFSFPRDPSKSRFRYLHGASFFMEQGFLGDVLVFEIKANAFLWKQVRATAGTLIRYEQQGIPADELAQRIRSGDRSLSGPILPPEGLFLWNVEYYPLPNTSPPPSHSR